MCIRDRFALVFGAIGYIDDYQKVKHHHNTGLTALQKFALQLAAAVAFLCLMRYEGMLSPNLYIPFWNTHIVLPWVVYLVFAAFVIVGTVNAVNITDGLDGLSSSVTLPVAIFFAAIGWRWAEGYLQLSLFSAPLDLAAALLLRLVRVIFLSCHGFSPLSPGFSVLTQMPKRFITPR